MSLTKKQEIFSKDRIRKTLIGTIEFSNAKIYVDGTETRNPTLIGLAVLDAMDNKLPSADFETNKKTLEEFIKTNNHRSTPERFEILKMVHDVNSTFDIETVYVHMQQRGYHVSRATVYNTVNLLLKCSILQRNMVTMDCKKSEFQLI